MFGTGRIMKRVLWVCNIMPPAIGEVLKEECSVKEGWISGILEKIIEKEEQLELGICYPVVRQTDKEGRKITLKSQVSGKEKQVICYEFEENTAKPEEYEGKPLEERMEEIINSFSPDMLHIFGTEYGHALAAVKSFFPKEKILVGLQGMVGECAKEYMADLSPNIQRRKTFRDVIKRDTMPLQQKKFQIRAKREEQILNLAGCVTGRTLFDDETSKKINPKLIYYKMNETMRKEFYEGQWSLEHCNFHQIFFSQADYPLKGFHHMIKAAGKLKKEYPDIKIYVAGNGITGYSSLKEKIKISAYGKYLRELIKQEGMEEKIIFMGKLSAEEMKKQYLLSHCYVCASSIENSPNSLAEAMLLGVPVIAPNTGGIPSVMEGEKEGLLFQKNNWKDLAASLERIWKDDNLVNNISREGRKRAAELYNPETNYNRLLEIYNKMTEGLSH